MHSHLILFVEIEGFFGGGGIGGNENYLQVGHTDNELIVQLE